MCVCIDVHAYTVTYIRTVDRANKEGGDSCVAGSRYAVPFSASAPATAPTAESGIARNRDLTDRLADTLDLWPAAFVYGSLWSLCKAAYLLFLSPFSVSSRFLPSFLRKLHSYYILGSEIPSFDTLTIRVLRMRKKKCVITRARKRSDGYKYFSQS